MSRQTAEQAYWDAHGLPPRNRAYRWDIPSDWDLLLRHIVKRESYASIAREYGVSASTVRRRLERRRVRLEEQAVRRAAIEAATERNRRVRLEQDAAREAAREAHTERTRRRTVTLMGPREAAFDSHDWWTSPADADETTTLMRCARCGAELRVQRQGDEPIITPWDYLDLAPCPLPPTEATP